MFNISRLHASQLVDYWTLGFVVCTSSDDSSGSERDETPDHSYYIWTPSLRYDPPGGLVDDSTTGNPSHSTDTCEGRHHGVYLREAYAQVWI